tara:strand:+ start:90041 stop:90640 length:600 start_codon:yes stop_codon:yes gene_type:complete
MAKSKNRRKSGTLKGQAKKAGAKPQQSFKNLVAEASAKAVTSVIDQRIQQLGLQLAQNQARELGGIATRLAVMEQICIEKLGITNEDLAERVAEFEDEALGFEKVETVAEGDTVRVTVAAKKSDEKEYGEESNVQITNTGLSPYTLPKEIEEGVVNLTTGETVEIAFGKDDAMKAKVTIDRISRKIVEETDEKSDSTEE